MPCEVFADIFGNPSQGSSIYEVFDNLLQHAYYENNDEVENRLKQNRLVQRRSIKAAKERQGISQQHRLSYHQCGGGRNHEAEELLLVIIQEKLRGKYDEVESESEEQRRRKHLLKFPDDEGEGASDGHGNLVSCGCKPRISGPVNPANIFFACFSRPSRQA